MTHEGVKRLLMVMTSAYPNFKPSNMSMTIEIWENILKDYEDQDVAQALKLYIVNDTKGFAPAIGQIIENIPKKDDDPGELEAWGLVRRAIRNGTYGAEEEFAKLPDVVKKAVGSAGQIRDWAKMSIDSVDSVGQSNFLRSYRAAVKVKKKFGLPDYIGLETKSKIAIEKKKAEGIPIPDDLKEVLRRKKDGV